jgi:hypothetical protein
VGLKAPAFPGQLRHKGCASHNGRFLNGHGDKHIASINLEIEGDSKRNDMSQLHFRHVVGRIEAQAPAECVFGAVRVKTGVLGEHRAALMDGESVESRQTRCLHLSSYGKP